MKDNKIWLAREVIDTYENIVGYYANIVGYEDIGNYFDTTKEHIRVSPLMIKTLIEYFCTTNRPDHFFTNIHTTFWDGLYYSHGDGLRKFIDVDNNRYDDVYWYNQFASAFKRKLIDCGDTTTISVETIDTNAFWLCSSPTVDNQRICHHTIISDLFLAHILGAKKEFTKIYLKAIAAQVESPDNKGKLLEFENAMKSLTLTQKKDFDALLSNDRYSYYNSTDELLGEFRNCFNEPKFASQYPWLRKITPLHLCVAQTVGTLCIGLLTGQSKEVQFGALTLANAVCCAVMYNVYRKSNNFTEFTKISIQNFKAIKSKDNEILPYTFMLQAVVSATNLLVSGVSGHRLSSIFNLAVVAAAACKILQPRDVDVFTFGLNP